MKKSVCALALLCSLAALAQPAGEGALRAAVEQAVWPGDIVRAADTYLRAYPAAADAAEVLALRQRAGDAWRLLSRNDVRLYRSAFDPRNAGPDALPDIRLAALGDSRAAVRLAHASRQAGDAPAAQRYVGWLQLAASLGDRDASYELALYYRRGDQPLLAARYEAEALAMGYQPAPGLDHARK